MTLPTLQERGGLLSGLTQGVGQGLQQAMPSIAELILTKQKQKQNIDLLEKIRGRQPTNNINPPNPMQSLEMDQGNKIGAQLLFKRDSGEDLSPQELNFLNQQMQQKPQLGMEKAPSFLPQQSRFSPEEEEILALEAMKNNPDFSGRLIDIEKMKQKRMIEESREGRESRKETSPYINNINEAYENAEMSDAYVDRLEQLDKEGDVAGALPAKVVEFFDLPIGFLSAPSQEVEKISATMGTNVAKAYGFGNIRAIEFSNFIKSLPTLMNTAEGRERIYQVMRYKNSLDKARFEVKNQIVDKYKGNVPSDIQDKITKQMTPYYKKFGEVLKYGYEGTWMYDPKGQLLYVHKEDVPEALNEKWRLK